MASSGTIGQKFHTILSSSLTGSESCRRSAVSTHSTVKRRSYSFLHVSLNEVMEYSKKKYIALILHTLSHQLCRQYSYAQAVQQLGMLQMMPVTMVSLSRSGQSTVKSCKLWSRRLQISSGARPSKKFPSKFKATRKKEHRCH